MANYPQELAQDAVCQSHTGHMIGLWFLPTRPLRLNTNEWMYWNAIQFLFANTNFTGRSDAVQASWNVMAHAQKPDFVFRRNGRVHLNRPVGVSSWGVRISGSNVGYAMFRGSVKGTGYTLHSPVSHSLPLLCVTVCHHISAGLYNVLWWLLDKIKTGYLQNFYKRCTGMCLNEYSYSQFPFLRVK